MAANGIPSDTFKFRKRQYQLTGYEPSRPTYPFIAKRLPDGKEFSFSVEFILSEQAPASRATPSGDKTFVGTVYEPEPEGAVKSQGSNAMIARWDRNMERLVKIDNECKAAGQLLYRYITHQYADGNAIYQIVGLTGKAATIRVVTGIGDDWTIPAWGERATIAISKAQEFVRRRDSLAAIFSEAAE